jgi:hypothetical protein
LRIIIVIVHTSLLGTDDVAQRHGQVISWRGAWLGFSSAKSGKVKAFEVSSDLHKALWERLVGLMMREGGKNENGLYLERINMFGDGGGLFSAGVLSTAFGDHAGGKGQGNSDGLLSGRGDLHCYQPGAVSL